MKDAPAFTLVEVLVALVVAAIMASGLLALQHHGLNQARETDLLWNHLNTAQEALIGRDLTRTSTEIHPQWQMSVAPSMAERPSPWISLITRGGGRELEWSWPAATP